MNKKIIVAVALVFGVLLGVFAGGKIQTNTLKFEVGEDYTHSTQVVESESVVDQTVETSSVEAQEEQAEEPTQNDVQKHGVMYTIMGEGRVEVVPDMAEVNIKIEYSDRVRETSRQTVKDMLESLHTKLDENNVQNIKQNRLYTFKCRGHEDCFKSNVVVTFGVDDLANLKTIIDNIDDDYVEIIGINYKVSNYEQCYAEAMNDAINNATQKCQNIEEKQISVVGVEEEYCCCPCMYREYDSENISLDLQNPIEITACVKIHFLAN